MFPPLKNPGEGALDSLPRKTADAVAKAMPAQDADGGTVDLIDGKVIPLLERIERNTRRSVAAAAKAGGSRTTGATAALPPSAPTYRAKAERQASAPLAEFSTVRRVSSGAPVAAKVGATAQAGTTPQVRPQDIAKGIARATASIDRNRSASGQFVAGGSKSAQALRESKATDAERADRKGKADASGNTIFDGKRTLGGNGRSGEAVDAAGSATGGPIWGAIMEMKEFAGKMREDSQNADPNSIKSILAKKLQDKTGVTAVKGKVAGATDKLHAKALAWAKAKKPAALAPPAKVPAKPVPVKFDTPPSQGGGDSGGGLMGLVGDFAGKGLGKLGGKVGGRFGKVLSGAGALLGGGEGALGGLLGGGAGGVAKAGGGMFGKMLGSGAKFLGRAAGPIAALAMNLPDLVSGISTGDAGKTGGAVGGIGGSLAGGMAGAALGTAILPGVGTLIGGAIGAFAGDFLGGKAGKAIGGTMFGGVKDSVDGLADEVAGNTKSLEKKDGEPPATGVNWSDGSLMDRLSSAGTEVKRFLTGEKVAPIAGSGELGSLSARYESGGRGSEAIGYDTKGGTSYGKYQIATRTGTMNKFMNYAKENNPALYERLKAAGPADSGKDGKFAQEWKASVADGTMGTAEHDFIKKTHFDPAFQNIGNKGLRDQISGSKTLQDVLLSTSVQHGGAGASGIMNKVYKPGMSQEDLVNAVYAERGTRFGGSSAAVQASVANRFADERAQAQARLAAEKTGTTALAANAPKDSTTPMYVPPPGSKPGGGRSRPAQAPQVAEAPSSAITAAMAQPVSTALAQAPQPAQVAALATPAPSPMPGMTSLVAEESSAPMKMPTVPGFDTSKIEGLLGQIVKASETVAAKADKDTETGDIPTIPFEFDDTALALMAHDRV